MLRFPSGVTDQYIYFVAVDSGDYVTRETGLSGFTVRRSRNGGASAAYTTPTINETDTTNMPGVYELLLDEDMTLDAGDHSQAVCLHITQASMAPVTLQFELYRPDVTAGETVTVSSGAVSTVTTVNGLAAGAVSAAAIATGAIDADALAADAGTEIASAVWADATRTLTAIDEDSTTLDLDATIRSAVGLAAADLDTQLAALPTAAENADAVWDEALAGHLTAGSTGEALDAAGSGGTPPTAAEIADAVWDEDATAHQTQGTFGQAIGDPGADTDTIYGLVNTNLDATVSSRSSQTSVDTIDDFLDTEVAAILADTNELQTDWADGGRLDLILDARASQTSVDTVDTVLDALVADIGANGAGLTAIPWNAAWDAEVESEVNDGLVAYDAATGTDVSGITPPTASAIADEVETRTLNANIVKVNSVDVDGTGTEADPWGPV